MKPIVRFRIQRSLYQGDVTSPKTKHSERVVDLPAAIVKKLKEYGEKYPELDEGYIFRQTRGRPIDPDTWFKERFVPTAVRTGLRPG